MNIFIWGGNSIPLYLYNIKASIVFIPSLALFLFFLHSVFVLWVSSFPKHAHHHQPLSPKCTHTCVQTLINTSTHKHRRRLSPPPLPDSKSRLRWIFQQLDFWWREVCRELLKTFQLWYSSNSLSGDIKGETRTWHEIETACWEGRVENETCN